MRRNSSGRMSVNGANTEAKAQLTHTSIGPSSASTRSAAASTASRSETSVGMASGRRPASWTSRAASPNPAGPRARSATSSPCAANARAAARPTPADAPVTTTTRPVTTKRFPVAPAGNRPPRLGDWQAAVVPSPSATATASTLAGLAVLHAVWGSGLRVPGVDPDILSDAVIGSGRPPPPAACYAVAGALGTAAALVAGSAVAGPASGGRRYAATASSWAPWNRGACRRACDRRARRDPRWPSAGRADSSRAAWASAQSPRYTDSPQIAPRSSRRCAGSPCAVGSLLVRPSPRRNDGASVPTSRYGRGCTHSGWTHVARSTRRSRASIVRDTFVARARR